MCLSVAVPYSRPQFSADLHGTNLACGIRIPCGWSRWVFKSNLQRNRVMLATTVVSAGAPTDSKLLVYMWHEWSSLTQL